jgi:type I restriction enzyme S subunit
VTTVLARVGDLAQQIRGVTYSKSEAASAPAPGFLPVLRAGNITEHGLTFTDLVYVPEARVNARQRIRRHDVLIAASSGSLDVVGKAGRAQADFDGGFGAFCKVLRPSERVDPGYFAHFFKTMDYRRTISSLAAGANINNLRSQHLDDLQIPLPPLVDQRRIAEILDEADALRAKRRQALVHLNDLTQSIFLDMFGDPSTARGHDWELATIGAVADIQGGLTVNSARKRNPIEVPYLRVANVHRGRLELAEIKTLRATEREIDRTRLQLGDLLVVEGHGNADEIGRGALWDGSIDGCVHQNHLIRVRFDQRFVLPVYGSGVINSQGGRRHLLRAGKTTSGLNTISVSDVRSTPIATPPVRLQETFAHRFDGIRSLQASQQRAVVHLDALFASLQARAFAGAL